MSAPWNRSVRILASKLRLLLVGNTGWGEGKCRQAAQDSGCRHCSSSIHSVFVPQVVSASDGGGPSLKPSLCRLAADLPRRKDRKSGLGVWEPRGAVLEQVVREGRSKKTVFSRDLKEVGRVSQAPGGWGWGVVGMSDTRRPGRLEWSRGEEDRKRLAGGVQALGGCSR